MALHMLNGLTRGLQGELPTTHLIWLRCLGSFKKWRTAKVVIEGEESANAPLYSEEIPESVLEKRKRHLPDKKENPFKDELKQCVLCRLNITPDYKNVRLLSQFVSGFSGVIYDRHITGLCSHRQKQIVREIEKSRVAGLMAVTYKLPKFQNDPDLFDPARPVRRHPYF